MSDSGGLFESLKRLLRTLLSILQTRLELLSNDLEEARMRIGQMLVYACVALFCFCWAIMLLTVFIVALFWDSYRLQVLGGLCAGFFVAGVLTLNTLRSLARERPKLFASSLAELSKDRENLASSNE